MSASPGVGLSGQDEHDSSTAKKINSLLNSPKTRVEGLRLLNLFLPHCPEEVFLNFCVSWMQNCCKVDGLTKNWKCSHLLRNLFETSSKYPELKKSVSFFITTRYFDFFFKHLSNSQGGWFCTETCMLFYRGACGPFQESLERQLVSEIEKNVAISATVGHCFALLPCIGGGGNDGVNYKKNWKTQFLKFLDICHSVLNDLFVDVEELQEYETHGHTYKRQSERNVNYLATQFSNYSSVLSFMLLNQYPAPKAVPSDQIFHLVCRGLAPNPRATARRQTTDAISLKKVLPEIYCSLLSLLKAVIVTCKNQLLPYSHLICKLIKQILEVDLIDVNEKEFKRLRVSTYGVLCDWLAVARNGSCVEVISSTVVSAAVGDIQPKQEVILLKEAKLQNREKSKGQATCWINVAATSRLCHTALKALQFLLKFAGTFLDPGLQKFLQEVVVKLLVELQRSSDFAVPFTLPSCRKELYSLLLELTIQPCLKWPPPTNFALRLFSKGLNDNSPEVSAFCSEALNFATVIIHPQYDNGGFSFSSPPDDSNRIREPQINEEPMEMEPMENEKEVETFQEEIDGIEENVPESKATVFIDKINNSHQESEVSSDEDSRTTITFTKESPERLNKAVKENEEKTEELSQANQTEEDSNASEQKILSEGLEKIPAAIQKTPSPQKSPSVRETPETNKMNKTIRLQDSDGSNSISPEPTNEDGHVKKRYFLRSKTNASSEESEEIVKRTSSPEVAKATPSKTLKMTPGVASSKKRPRTRALSKAEGETEVKKSDGEKTEDNDDEDDIRAAFHDSFID